MDKVSTKATAEKSGRKPKSALGSLTMREAIVVLGGVLVIVGSLFPIPWSKTVSVNMWIFPGLPFHLLIALVLPLLVAGGFAWRRFTGRTRVRIGSLSLDQAGSVVALFAAAYFFNSYVASMSPAYLIGFIGALAMVVGTTLASYFGALRRDFATGGDTVLGSDLAPVARDGQPRTGTSVDTENKDPESPAAKQARVPVAAKAARGPGETMTGKDGTRDGAPAQPTAPSTAGVTPGAAAMGKPVPDSAVATSAAGAPNAGSPTSDASPTSGPTPAAAPSQTTSKRETPAAGTPASGATGSQAATGVPAGPGAATPDGDAKATAPRTDAGAIGKDATADSSKPEAPADPATAAANDGTGGGTPAASAPKTGDQALPSGAAPKTPRDIREPESETAAAKPETDSADSAVQTDSTASGTPSVPAKLNDKPSGNEGEGAVPAKPDAAEEPPASETPTPQAGTDAAVGEGPGAGAEPAIEPGTVKRAGSEASTPKRDAPTPSSHDQAKAPGGATDTAGAATSAPPAAKAGVQAGGGIQATAALSRADFEAHRVAAEQAKAQVEAESSFGARADSSEPEPVSTSFWFALNHPRPVFHHLNGTMLETLYPGTWILCVEDRGSDYFINLPDGRPAVLRNLDDLQFPEQ